MHNSAFLAMIQELTPIFRDVLDDDELIITPSTSAEDVEGWDSLSHIRLVVSIEKKLSMKFSAAEVSELKNVGDLVKLILGKKSDG